jgi:hypothetical protein
MGGNGEGKICGKRLTRVLSERITMKDLAPQQSTKEERSLQ